MCVIIHTAKKRLLKRSELTTAMNNNKSGFFLAELLPKGRRNMIRTLDMQKAIGFWEKIPDDSEVVMHFRVPSRGCTSESNVHGWEDSGILFCHNRTFHSLGGVMREENWAGTDSEYFFRRLFMPLYKSMGGRGVAYKDGKLCAPLDRMVRAVCGDYNKVMMVMPDNKVLHYGLWEGETDRDGFKASNRSYLPEPVRTGLLSRLRSWFTSRN